MVVSPPICAGSGTSVRRCGPTATEFGADFRTAESTVRPAPVMLVRVALMPAFAGRAGQFRPWVTVLHKPVHDGQPILSIGTQRGLSVSSKNRLLAPVRYPSRIEIELNGTKRLGWSVASIRKSPISIVPIGIELP
jgi:hypothetical protein